MATTSVSARFQELFPETNLISLLTRCGGDAGDIFETLQDQYDAHEQEPLVGLLGIKAANIVFNQIASRKIISVCNTSSLVHLVGKSNLKPRLHESNINSSNTGKQTANSKNTHIILLHPPRFRQ